MSDLKKEATLDWQKVERFFEKILAREGYDSECVQLLGFFISQHLQNAESLLTVVRENLEDEQLDLEEIMVLIHMLFHNHKNLKKGHEVLMSYQIEVNL